MMAYAIKKLADLAGVSVRTLHYYDQLGLLKPDSRSASGYRRYGEKAALRLQQILFFRELGFSLADIRRILERPGFDALEALQAQRRLLNEEAKRTKRLIVTIDRTIAKLKGERQMEINEYYQGLSEKEIEQYRNEVRERWGEKTLAESEGRVLKMGKEKFAALQAEGNRIFGQIADHIPDGPQSEEVQALVGKWREWLENFHHYSPESILGLGRAYSQDARFAQFFGKIDRALPEFLTKAIEYYCGLKA